VAIGDSIRLASYQLKVRDVRAGENENYSWDRAVVEVYRNGAQIDTLQPERRFYKASGQPISEVSIRRRLNEDLYLNFAAMSEDGKKAVIQSYVFPLVSWIWIGFWVLLFGTLVCLVPSKVKYQYAKTEVVGMVGKHAQV
jgi:cytochrome c-type biogenesis protein CcmF